MSEQRKIIHDDNNGLDYVLVGDYYIPMLALPEENRPIGYWGMLRKEYLKKWLTFLAEKDNIIPTMKGSNRRRLRLRYRQRDGKPSGT